MRHCNLIMVSLLLFSCSVQPDYSKDNYWLTRKIDNNLDNNLYCEVYLVYQGGVWGGDVCTVYLTDSTSFRMYLGKELDHQQIRASLIDSENVLVYKVNIEGRNLKTIYKKAYNIPLLKKEGKFE